MGLIIEAAFRKAGASRARIVIMEIVAMVLAGIVMTAGYYVAEGIMYGNWIAAAIGIPWNIGQFALGMVLALLLAGALGKTSAKAYFTYKQPIKND